jgi:hypothetical protein
MVNAARYGVACIVGAVFAVIACNGVPGTRAVDTQGLEGTDVLVVTNGDVWNGFQIADAGVHVARKLVAGVVVVVELIAVFTGFTLKLREWLPDELIFFRLDVFEGDVDGPPVSDRIGDGGCFLLTASGEHEQKRDTCEKHPECGALVLGGTGHSSLRLSLYLESYQCLPHLSTRGMATDRSFTGSLEGICREKAMFPQSNPGLPFVWT